MLNYPREKKKFSWESFPVRFPEESLRNTVGRVRTLELPVSDGDYSDASF